MTDLQKRLIDFMDKNIYPNEDAYHAQLNGMENRFASVPLMDEPKGQS